MLSPVRPLGADPVVAVLAGGVAGETVGPAAGDWAAAEKVEPASVKAARTAIG